jgi:transposase
MDGQQPTYEELAAENVALRQQVQDLTEQVRLLTALVERLQRQLDDQSRTGKRQAAPFSKGPPKTDPKPPGRKPGESYGTHRRGAVPERIDEVIPVPLPAACPCCGGTEFCEHDTVAQYQIEIPRQVIHRRFDIQRARCGRCRRLVRGRHALQTSDAIGAAAVQLGPNLQAGIAILNKETGLPHGKIRRLLSVLFDLTIARSTSVRSMLRAARRVQPALPEIIREIRGSPVIKVDETGWKESGLLKWLHVLVSPRAVLYQIGGRGREVLESLIGADFAGTLIHDGYATYAGFKQALHQQCLAHLLKRCRELLEEATAGAVRFPRAVRDLLRRGLQTRDRYLREELTLQGARAWATKLTSQMEALVRPVKVHAGNERFAKWLEQHLAEIFVFLRDPQQVSATNNESEFELRFNVIARKLSGGNRSPVGINAQEVLPSIIRTCRKLVRDPFDYLRTALTATSHVPLILPAGR